MINGANVKPMSGFIGMNFQQTYGTQGFTIIIRTDFSFEPDRKYIVAHDRYLWNEIYVNSVYGN